MDFATEILEIKRTQHFKQWQLQHYRQRLSEERANGNIKAVAFLRSELYNLQKVNND